MASQLSAEPTEYPTVRWPEAPSEPHVVTAYESDKPFRGFCNLDRTYGTGGTVEPVPPIGIIVPIIVPQPLVRARGTRRLGGGRPRAVVRRSARGGDSGDPDLGEPPGHRPRALEGAV